MSRATPLVSPNWERYSCHVIPRIFIFEECFISLAQVRHLRGNDSTQVLQARLPWLLHVARAVFSIPARFLDPWRVLPLRAFSQHWPKPFILTLPRWAPLLPQGITVPIPVLPRYPLMTHHPAETSHQTGEPPSSSNANGVIHYSSPFVPWTGLGSVLVPFLVIFFLRI